MVFYREATEKGNNPESATFKISSCRKLFTEKNEKKKKTMQRAMKFEWPATRRALTRKNVVRGKKNQKWSATGRSSGRETRHSGRSATYSGAKSARHSGESARH